MKSEIGKVFGQLRRFHVYDHDAEEWMMSGVDFGDKGIVIDHKHNEEIEAYDNPEVIVQGLDNLQLVWEDESDDVEEMVMDPEIGGEIAECARKFVASREEVDPELVQVVEISSPNTVRYVIA